MNNDKMALCKPVSNTWLGILFIAAGLLIAASRLNIGIPVWLASWPAALIILGLVLGIYHRFKGFIWIIPAFWGCWLIAQLQFTSLHLGNYTAEAFIMLAGFIFIVAKPSRSHIVKGADLMACQNGYKMVAVLRNTSANITAKDFNGADITCVLGNARLNLQDADTAGGITIETVVFMGNAKIYLPAGWTVQNDITSIFADVKQHCINPNAVQDPGKVVKFDGTAIFGNIEIISC